MAVTNRQESFMTATIHEASQGCTPFLRLEILSAILEAFAGDDADTEFLRTQVKTAPPASYRQLARLIAEYVISTVVQTDCTSQDLPRRRTTPTL